ncbi:MAG: UDP-N-acetylmuramate--L-alanine ligase [Parcubacteria group bacterium]|nr:UDP-N-acetylmuramate--L-alanine ligase [Parcubacteria group bacterium]|tara:strand:+ start:502 stop:1887 length:1386 start_codon:yes stop_codon:yes gene_type:complete
MTVNLNNIKKIYFIGIKGVAMSGLAVICKEKGMSVSGSDVTEKFITDKILIDADIEIFENFLASNLDINPDLVVIGTSWDDNNIEVKEVKKRNIPFITDSEMRGLLSQEKLTIAVTGVHGKTTTTAMLAHVFSKGSLDPSYLIGTGSVPDLGNNAAWKNGKHFIVEGDEYIRSQLDKAPKFLDLEPTTTIITSLEWEHVDIFKDLAAIEKPFQELVKKTKKLIVACGDWPSVQKIIKGEEKKVVTYGFAKNNLYQAYDIRQEYDQTIFKVRKENVDLEEFKLKLFGEHNVLNALAVIIVSLAAGLRLEQIKDSLESFHGSERRFDVSEHNGIIFIDDYAHHPTEIKTTLKAIRHRYADKTVWCVFQPHMASRTKALFDDFSQSFNDANAVYFADIFASAREQNEDVTSKDLAEATKKCHQNVEYIGDLNQTVDYLKDKVKPGMVIVTMGAGDVYRVRDKLI